MNHVKDQFKPLGVFNETRFDLNPNRRVPFDNFIQLFLPNLNMKYIMFFMSM